MMGHAVRDLGGGLYHGLTGVVVEPYRKAKVICFLRFPAGFFFFLPGWLCFVIVRRLGYWFVWLFALYWVAL